MELRFRMQDERMGGLDFGSVHSKCTAWAGHLTSPSKMRRQPRFLIFKPLIFLKLKIFFLTLNICIGCF